MEKISFNNVKIFYKKNQPILAIKNLEIKNGSFNVILGKNGSGKSSLGKAIANIVPYNGTITIDNKNIKHYSRINLAKKVTFIQQQSNEPLEINIYNYVASGRNPYTNFMGILTKKDHFIIEKILRKMKIWNIRFKYLNELSGGQIQKTNIALGLIQETDILVVDEPTNHLDPSSMLAILKLLNDINKISKKTILLITHELYNGLLYADNVILIKDKKIFKSGSPKKIVTKENIKKLFNISVTIKEINSKQVGINDLKLT